MTNAESIASLIEPFGPQLPADQTVVELNRLYHAFEAQNYDERHREIYEQLPPLWNEMAKQALQQHPSTEWHILNFGCGTGFEAEQLLSYFPQGSVARLTCYDPSLEMIERCRSRVSSLFPRASYYADPNGFSIENECYNLLATNSLLHHLPGPVATIQGLLPLLSADAMWLAGHEPSGRFYRNPKCVGTLEAFLYERRWRKYFSPRVYLRRFRQILGLESDPAREAAREAFHQGLFNKRPSVHLVSRLVDLHVAHSAEEAALGRGFDPENLQQGFAGTWELLWMKSYSFMGTFYEGNLPRKWRHISHELSRRFPQDGANFCTVWKRI
jgi:SAM-dependent methyltransferase